MCVCGRGGGFSVQQLILLGCNTEGNQQPKVNELAGGLRKHGNATGEMYLHGPIVAQWQLQWRLVEVLCLLST